MAWVSIIFTALIAWVLWTVTSLRSNLEVARRTGLPVIISPVNPSNPLWMIAYKVLPIIRILKRLPFGLGQFARCTYQGWCFDENYALHAELGEAFVLVSPSSSELVLANPDASVEVLAQRKEFFKSESMYKPLEVFGPNVNTVNGEDWQRHRKITASSFNERTSKSVWNEALRQANGMLQVWLQQGQAGTKDTVNNITALALHVLTGAGFGMQHAYLEGVQQSRPGFTLTYRDALSLILSNILILFILPQRVLKSPFVPKKLREIGQATVDYQKHMEDMLARERRLISQREPGQGNLISALVRASEEAKEKSEGEATQGLTDKEIFGNIFIYSLAGHETTANSMVYAIVLLAANPEWQDWVAEEIQHVFGSTTDIESWSYEDSFPNLPRCLAVMYETIRLYNSVVYIPRNTGSSRESVSLEKSQCTLPPHTPVIINTQALHTNARLWGPDALTWRPGRWISSASETETETVRQPAPNGSFMPWSDGPRVCPGRKFAQVEFVAVMARLFHRHTVAPVAAAGESAQDTRAALVAMANESTISAITLQMLKPKSVALAWNRRV